MTYGVGLSASFQEVSFCLWVLDDSGHQNVIYSESTHSKWMHASLLGKIEEMLLSQRIGWKDVHYIVVDTGPASSFTGLRLSLAIVKTWAFLYPHIQIYETRSTRILYEEWSQKDYSPGQKVLVGYFGFQKRAYIEVFYDQTVVVPVTDVPMDVLIQQIEQSSFDILIGNLVDYLEPTVLQWIEYKSFRYPSIEYAQQKEFVSYQDLKPHYYRKTQAEENRYAHLGN